MAHQGTSLRTGKGVAIVAIFPLLALLAACGGTAVSSSAPTVSPAPSPAPTATPAPSATETPSAAPASPAPSPRVRPSLAIDLAELGAYLTSSITLVDLAETDLAVTVAYVDPDSGDSASLGTYTLGSMEQLTNSVPPGTYRLDFRQPADSPAGPSCTIEIGDADSYVFAAIESAVAIARTGNAPTETRELFVATSSLCQR